MSIRAEIQLYVQELMDAKLAEANEQIEQQAKEIKGLKTAAAGAQKQNQELKNRLDEVKTEHAKTLQSEIAAVRSEAQVERRQVKKGASRLVIALMLVLLVLMLYLYSRNYRAVASVHKRQSTFATREQLDELRNDLENQHLTDITSLREDGLEILFVDCHPKAKVKKADGTDSLFAGYDPKARNQLSFSWSDKLAAPPIAAFVTSVETQDESQTYPRRCKVDVYDSEGFTLDIKADSVVPGLKVKVMAVVRRGNIIADMPE